MTAMRYLGVALLVPLLSGCEPKLAPAKVEPEKSSTPAVQQVQPAASVPPAAPAAPAAPAIAAEPVAAAQVSQSTLVKKPLAAPAGSSAVPAVKQDNAAKEPPKSKLDLSLPPELTEQLNAERGGTEQALEPLLPSLFEESASSDNPFQLNGRLLSNERGDDYFKSLEGAEVQFEFKR